MTVPGPLPRPHPSDRGLLGFPSQLANPTRRKALSWYGPRRDVQSGVLLPHHSGRCILQVEEWGPRRWAQRAGEHAAMSDGYSGALRDVAGAVPGVDSGI